MTYLGYSIFIRSIAWHDGVEADIVDPFGAHVFIADSDRYSAEASAREIVDYATRKGLNLKAATARVLA